VEESSERLSGAERMFSLSKIAYCYCFDAFLRFSAGISRWEVASIFEAMGCWESLWGDLSIPFPFSPCVGMSVMTFTDWEGREKKSISSDEFGVIISSAPTSSSPCHLVGK